MLVRCVLAPLTSPLSVSTDEVVRVSYWVKLPPANAGAAP